MNNNLKLLLIVSLIANALLAGFLFGEVTHEFGRLSFEQKIAELSDASKERVHAAMDKLRAENEKTRDALSDARKKTLQLLTQDPFNEGAWNNHVAHIQKLRAEMSQRLSETVKKLAKSLPAHERPALAAMFGRGSGWERKPAAPDVKEKP